MTRRSFLVQATGAVGVMWAAQRCSRQPAIAIDVYKDPSCGCCAKWVEHMRANGFTATVTEGDMDPVRATHKIPHNVLSCHSALVGGYIIEGHVPAADVRALLAKKPTGVRGLAIPGMPASAPGMDMQPFQPYTVLTFDEGGNTGVFAQHDRA